MNFLEYNNKTDDFEEYLENRNKNVIKKEKKKESRTKQEDKKVSENSQQSNNNSFSSEEKSSKSSVYNNLVIDENVSIVDIKLIPPEIKEPTNLFSQELQKKNLNKSIKGNKYTQLLRKSNFDRNSVNININIISNEQSKYYQKANKILIGNLYSETVLSRGRKPGELDVSSVVGEKNYKDFLIKQDNDN